MILFFFLDLKLVGTCLSGDILGSGSTNDKETSIYITSPNYPENYGSRSDCRWTITTLNEKMLVMELTFIDFNTESNVDTLSIYNASDDDGEPIKKLSGFSTPSKIMLTGKLMHLKFTSDYNSNRRGFRILLKAYGK